MYDGLPGGALVLQPKVDSSRVATQHRTGMWASGTAAMSPAVTQLATVDETGRKENNGSAFSEQPTSRQLPKLPRPEVVEDVAASNTTVLPCQSRSVESEMSLASSRRVTLTIKLGSYDGVAIALETHLSKLDNCTAY